MKVVQINTVCGNGSTGRIVVSISEKLNKQGVENYVFYSGYIPSDYDNAKKINNRFDVRMHQLFSRALGDQGWHSYLATKKMIWKIKKIKPDLIHLHNLHGYYLHIGLLFEFFRQIDVPVVWSLHDCWAFTGHCTHFSKVKCDKWRTGCFSCPQLKAYPYSWLFDRSSELFNRKKRMFNKLSNLTIVCPSVWLAELAENSILKAHNIIVINNGIDLTVFKPTISDFKRRYKIPLEKFVILGVASGWNEGKGIDIFKKINDVLNKEKYQIVLVGGHNKAISPEIIMIDNISNRQILAEIYSAADVFVNPTREDNFPTVNIEALACGTPVITCDVGGAAEIIDENCGTKVALNDIEGFVKAIEAWCDRGEAKDTACIARSNIFTQERMTENYYKLYKNLLSHNDSEDTEE